MGEIEGRNKTTHLVAELTPPIPEVLSVIEAWEVPEYLLGLHSLNSSCWLEFPRARYQAAVYDAEQTPYPV